MYHKIRIPLLLVCFFILMVEACRKDITAPLPVPPPAKTGAATTTLEASFVSTPPDKTTSAYWSTADYLPVDAKNISINQLYSDGWLNMTGSINGLSSFNKGNNPSLTLKAAYDNTYIYILATWYDSTANFSSGNWFWNGAADPLKSDSANGWTSQRNSDGLALAFEISSASSTSGSFATVGCAASCHSSGGTAYMYPDNGKVDIWNWNTARSAPLGYSEDLVAGSTGLYSDAGTAIWTRNNAGTNRGGPAYEWNGITQNYTLPNGSATILDPAYFLLSTNKTSFAGNVRNGDSIYHTIFPGNADACATCHGNKGEGGDYGSINSVAMNEKSRSSLISNMINTPEMETYFPLLTSTQQTDVIAFIRGLAGVPGVVLSQPDGSNADILAVSNVTPIDIKNTMNTSTSKHTKYTVLLKRKLKTNNSDDAQFDLSASKTFKFGIALMDNDGKNHIGSLLETLTFKQ